MEAVKRSVDAGHQPRKKVEVYRKIKEKHPEYTLTSRGLTDHMDRCESELSAAIWPKQ